MHKKAVEQARERLRRAEAALPDINELQDAFVYEKFELAWSNFLLAASTIYSKLEQGAKSDKKSGEWFARIKHERRTDPLLSYIHHARNADEHGLQDFTKRRTPELVPTDSNSTVQRDADGNMVGINFTVGRSSSGIILPSRSDLATVYDDRYNDSFDPPTEHLGEPLPDQKPSTIAHLAYDYLRKMVDVADAMTS